MASQDPFFSDNNWFKKPAIPFQPSNLVSVFEALNPSKPQPKAPNFAAVSVKPSSRKQRSDTEKKPGKYTQMLEQFYWECENLPDYRHTPEVERILNNDDDSIFEKRENATPEEIEENEKLVEQLRASPVVQFLARAEEIADKINELELKANSVPYRKEDKKLWQVCCWNFFAELVVLSFTSGIICC